MTNIVKNVILTLVLSFALAQVSVLFSQDIQPSDNNQVIIIKESIDKDGSKKVEKILKGDLSDEEINTLLESENGDIQIIIGRDKSPYFDLDRPEKELWKKNSPSEIVAEDFLFQSDKPSLGIYLEEKNGKMIVASVIEDSGAEVADIQSGDVLKSINSVEINNMNDIRTALKDKDFGDEVNVVVIRDAKKLTKTVELKENSTGFSMNRAPKWENRMPFFRDEFPMLSMNKPKMGIQIEEHDEGVLIAAVNNNSPAEKAGLKEGDIILLVDETKILDVDQLVELIRAYKPGKSVDIQYIREGNTATTTLKLGGSKKRRSL